MSRPIKNVAVTGASGRLGSAVLERLVSSGKFNIKVLRRNGSKSTFALGTQVVDVDFESVDSLKAALAGQDAVVAPLGALALGIQKPLIDAAIAAGVQRFLPSEFGADLSNSNNRKLPVFAGKVEIADYLVEKAKDTPLTYTVVSNGAFLDWGLRNRFIIDISEYKPTIFDGGDAIFSTTTLASVGDAVVGILLHPEETKNRRVYIEDLKISQNQLLALARRVAPGKPWEPQQASLDAATKRSDERLTQGLFDGETFLPYIYRSMLDPASDGNFQKTDNALLGLKGKTEEDVVELLKQVLN
ncbi:hypothetical protein TOPH_07180 [Tolypocladium ophioglossoides CBS 100239]|uniref:NmrA-like domain-containing protein n=1 Tax=Tolypocladium ophioglossoides (strain CBS 100239) TaxID=1163406 RepID=A0A0L0N2T0_TOLOC|nr:hypothetical protein TOPH_07180 [Tolypocladium ophioglossoides CBS 100239]